MDGVEDLTTLAGRLATFEQPHHVAKRRASSTKKKAQPSVGWPHKTPTPDDLARAGFFYKPLSGSSDSVTCFLCDKALDGWEAGDIPATEHLSHVPDCGWAINVCIELRSQDMDRAEEDPNNEQMMAARRSTFMDAWPHEKKKGWKCKTQKMVAAGWCYAPLPEADDCVHCFYCGVSLDGWEPKDDPWEEHRKRAPDCHFFSLVEDATNVVKQAKAKRPRAASRASRVSRMSTQSNMTLASEAPSHADVPDEPAGEDETMLTTTSASTRATKKATKKTAPKMTRTAKNKKVSMMETSVVQADPPEELQLADIASPLQDCTMPKPTKARGQRALKASSITEQEVLDERPRQTGKVAKAKKSNKQPEATLDSIETQPELGLDTSVLTTGTGRVMRGTKRTSDGLAKSVLSSSIRTSPILRAPDSWEETIRGARETTPEVLADNVGLQEQKDSTPTREGTHPDGVLRNTTGGISNVRSLIMSTGTSKERNMSHSPRSEAARISSPSIPGSPQLSDMENIPPSSRPSLAAPVASDARRLGSTTSTPIVSPYKRNVVVGGLSTTHPWTAVDLETAFLPSPASKGRHHEQRSPDTVLQNLTSPEKKMSVEEWIVWNAQKAEQKLKEECERLIGVFEGAGNQALRSLEGIHVA